MKKLILFILIVLSSSFTTLDEVWSCYLGVDRILKQHHSSHTEQEIMEFCSTLLKEKRSKNYIKRKKYKLKKSSKNKI
jgi:hypothetical protein